MAIFERDIGEGIAVKIETGAIPSDRNRHSRLIITAVYDYMESDPILRVTVPHIGGFTTTRYDVTITIDPAIIDRRITSFNFYISNNPEEVVDLSDWIEDFAGYFLKSSMTTEEGWSDNSKSILVSGVEDRNALNLLDSLGHAPQLEGRRRFTPRYITRSQRRQGSVVVIDDGDRNLALSTYSGFGVHEDENFVDLRVDNQANPLKHSLDGRGEILGLEVFENIIYVFRETELEPVDLYSGVSDLQSIDFLARNSLLRTPYGLFWSGRAGIYAFLSGGGGFRLINDSWKNRFDGTDRDVQGDPYITETHRQEAVSGYDPFNVAVWFHLDKTYRFHILSESTWSVRDAEDAVDYITTKDGKLVIVTSNGLFEYPLQDGNKPYEFQVAYDGLSSAGGVPYEMTFNFGSLYNISSDVTLYDLLIDYRGSSNSGDGFFEVSFYANEDINPFDTKRFKVDGPPISRLINPRGKIESLRVEIKIPDVDTNLTDVQKLDISKLTLGVVAYPLRRGNT